MLFSLQRNESTKTKSKRERRNLSWNEIFILKRPIVSDVNYYYSILRAFNNIYLHKVFEGLVFKL